MNPGKIKEKMVRSLKYDKSGLSSPFTPLIKKMTIRRIS